VAATSDGYIWFTTNEGLVRFDGVRFKVFNRSNTSQIANNRMSGVFVDKSGTIWMNNEEGEILCYDKGVFKLVMKAGEIGSGAPSGFFQDPSGSIIFYKSDPDDQRLANTIVIDGFIPLAIDDSLRTLST
jgi:ligand-binding sensor domain-containing protein